MSLNPKGMQAMKRRADCAEICRVGVVLRERFGLARIAPGHCTGEPGFAALMELFGDDYLFAGLGQTLALPAPLAVTGGGI